MKCDNCGEDICLGSEYYHYPFLDLYFHIDCEPTDSKMVTTAVVENIPENIPETDDLLKRLTYRRLTA